MKEFIEKLIGRLEETDLNDIQMVVSEVLKKYGFPKESIVQDEIWDALDELSTNKFAIEIINQLAKEYKGGWIPCSERLPEEYDRYVWLSFTNQYCSYVQKAHWECGKFKWLNGRNIKDEPVAWKPYFAPEPYQPKGDQTE